MPRDPLPPHPPLAEPAPMSRAHRVGLLALGYACLGLAALGAVLPLLPTTVFLIIAAWAFGRASPALRARLLSDPRVGPGLRNWQQHGTVSRRAKRAAAIAMAASWVLATALTGSILVSVISGLCMGLVAAWLLTRPSEPPAMPSEDRAA